MNDTILRIDRVSKHFQFSHKRVLKAVDNVSFDIVKGETFGLVGESGCGKTTLGRVIKGIYRATSGKVFFENREITSLRGSECKQYMRDVQMIFQDPFSSLNPRMTVKDLIAEGLNIHRIGTKKDRIDRVYELLDLVGLNKQFITRYAHEFSGGQRQRLVIARALAVDPKFIICDEPISALDVSIQAQIVNLLQELQDKLGLSYLFIAHDLSMVKHVSDRIAVMYLGKIVEMAKKKELFDNPLHPYTQALLASIPIPDPVLERAKEGFTIQGEIPSPFILGEGCAFKTRCPHHHKACDKLNDSHKSVGNNHFVMCTLFDH